MHRLLSVSLRIVTVLYLEVNEVKSVQNMDDNLVYLTLCAIYSTIFLIDFGTVKVNTAFTKSV